MKMRKELIFAAAALMLAACSNDESMDNWAGEIRLSSALQTQEVQTRGTSQTLQGTKIASGVKVGVFINEENGGTSTTYTQNAEYTSNGEGGWNNPPTTYFPQSGAGVEIYAYAPRQTDFASVTGKYTFTVQPDQNSEVADEKGYLASDLLWGKPAQNPVARTSSPVAITFSHKLSKIDVTLTAGDGLTADDLANAEVSIVKPRRNVDIAMNTGVLSDPTTAANTDDVLMAKLPNSTTLTASAIIPPQSFAQDAQFIKVKLVSKGELFYTLPAAITLNEGKVYKYEITVNLTGLSLYSKEIVDWTAETGQGAYTGGEGNATM